MDPAIGLAIVASAITAIAALGAAGITAYFGHKSARLKLDAERKTVKIAELQAELRHIYGQVAAFHQVEQLYAESIATARGSTPRTVKTEFRNMAEDCDVARPTLTRRKCESRLTEIRD